MTEKKAAKPETVYILLVQTGRAEGDGLPDGATGAALVCYASGRTEKHAVDETVKVLRQAGMAPLEVSSYGTSDAPDRQQRLSITEDTAILTMKFSDTLMANLSASRTFGPPQCQLRLHSTDEFVTVSEDSFIVSDNSGKATKRSNFKSVRDRSISRMLEDFALSVDSPDKSKFAAHRDVDLNNMAVIESAYLSAKTSMPEEPGRILEMVGNEPTNWTSAAKKIV
ncbi:MAG: hypothetical protein IIC03_02440 [Proteobacteria bacterium]|nr:hypothetical protein [Pseudomonadota bacterium]